MKKTLKAQKTIAPATTPLEKELVKVQKAIIKAVKQGNDTAKLVEQELSIKKELAKGYKFNVLQSAPVIEEAVQEPTPYKERENIFKGVTSANKDIQKLVKKNNTLAVKQQNAEKVKAIHYKDIQGHKTMVSVFEEGKGGALIHRYRLATNTMRVLDMERDIVNCYDEYVFTNSKAYKDYTPVDAFERMLQRVYLHILYKGRYTSAYRDIILKGIQDMKQEINIISMLVLPSQFECYRDIHNARDLANGGDYDAMRADTQASAIFRQCYKYILNNFLSWLRKDFLRTAEKKAYKTLQAMSRNEQRIQKNVDKMTLEVEDITSLQAMDKSELIASVRTVCSDKQFAVIMSYLEGDISKRELDKSFNAKYRDALKDKLKEALYN